jgi:cyanophycinase
VTGIFISGGDQARLAAKLGGTPLVEAIGDRVRDGLVLAGSSAGAAGMSTSMIVRGRPTPGPYAEGVRLAQGLGILRNIIIDQHFTQRHRLTRLITAVAYNPINLGIGIDEDTAIVVTNGMLEVIGSGTVTIVDGSSISFSDIAEKQPRRPFALCDLRIHILNSSLRFDIHERRPLEYLSEYR